MKKFLLFLLLFTAGFVGAYFTQPGRAFLVSVPYKAHVAFSYLFPTKVYPGGTIIEAAESTGSLAPEYYKRYVYTYEAHFEGKLYTQENSNFIVQKIIPTEFPAGGHNTVKISTAADIPNSVWFALYQNSFDSQQRLIEKKLINYYKIAD